MALSPASTASLPRPRYGPAHFHCPLPRPIKNVAMISIVDGCRDINQVPHSRLSLRESTSFRGAKGNRLLPRSALLAGFAVEIPHHFGLGRFEPAAIHEDIAALDGRDQVGLALFHVAIADVDDAEGVGI